MPSAAHPVCGSAEPRRRVLRGRGRPLGGCRALGGGRPGAASSSFAAAAASSRCSVSREPRVVDAEPLGSEAASSPRCSRTSAWCPEPCGLRTRRGRAPVLLASRFPSLLPPPTLLQPAFPSPLGKWFPLPGEVSGGRRPPAAGAVTCRGGRAAAGGRGASRRGSRRPAAEWVWEELAGGPSQVVPSRQLVKVSGLLAVRLSAGSGGGVAAPGLRSGSAGLLC